MDRSTIPIFQLMAVGIRVVSVSGKNWIDFSSYLKPRFFLVIYDILYSYIWFDIWYLYNLYLHTTYIHTNDAYYSYVTKRHARRIMIKADFETYQVFLRDFTLSTVGTIELTTLRIIWPSYKGFWMCLYTGQIIATSHDLTSKGSWGLISGKSRLVKHYILAWYLAGSLLDLQATSDLRFVVILRVGLFPVGFWRDEPKKNLQGEFP